jgi:hypothetical protein
MLADARSKSLRGQKITSVESIHERRGIVLYEEFCLGWRVSFEANEPIIVCNGGDMLMMHVGKAMPFGCWNDHAFSPIE